MEYYLVILNIIQCRLYRKTIYQILEGRSATKNPAYTYIYIYTSRSVSISSTSTSRWLSLSQTFISPRTEDLSLTSILLSHDVNTHSHLSNCTTRSARWHLDTRSIRKISIREQLPPCVSIFRQGKLFTAEKIETKRCNCWGYVAD